MSAGTVENKTRSVAVLVTALFHAIVIVLLILKGIALPDPPLQAGGTSGMLVSLGNVDEATGNIMPMSEEPNTKPIVTQEEMVSSAEQNEKIITQEIENTVAVKSAEKASETPVNTERNPENTQKENTSETVETPPKVDASKLYSGKKNSSNSIGSSTKGQGTQGAPDGEEGPFRDGKGGNGNGDPGPGGPDNSTGAMKQGISHSLANRKAQSLTKPQYTCSETGTVVVDIWVDQNGNVVRAEPGAKGTTTASSCLKNKAREAALKTKFNASNEAPEEQRGTIVYRFTIK